VVLENKRYYQNQIQQKRILQSIIDEINIMNDSKDEPNSKQ